MGLLSNIWIYSRPAAIVLLAFAVVGSTACKSDYPASGRAAPAMAKANRAR